MRKKFNKCRRRFVRYLKETWMNKVMALVLVALGILCTIVSGGDGTAMFGLLIFAIPIFFEKKNVFE